MIDLAHVLVPFLYGFVPTTVVLSYSLGYCELWQNVRQRTRYHPSKHREMTYWEKLRDRSKRLLWHRVALLPFVVGVIVLVVYSLIRWTVLLVL
jgi:hypothetical protein